MKKNRTTRLVVLVLFLAIVTAVIISGTFAKYTTSGSGTGTATVAKWNVALTAENATFSETEKFTLAETFTNVAEGKIAPGTHGEFNVAINAAGSEVAIDYVLKIEMVTDADTVPTNIKFYRGTVADHDEIMMADGAYEYKGTIALADVSKEVSIPISWIWDYETDSSTDADGDGILDTDEQDTEDGIDAETMEFKVTLTATQAKPVEVEAGA